ncbi:MAG: hypothetical protein ABSC55_26195 [Syntrophorhabdales bacterium]
MQEALKQLRRNNKKGGIILEDENPIIENSTKLRNYLSLLSLLVHSEKNEFFGRPIIISSEDYPMVGFPFDSTLWENALIMFMAHGASSDDKTKSDSAAWTCFPYVQKRLLGVRDCLAQAFARGDSDLLMYIGNILRVVEHDARDIRVRFLLLVSLIELLLTHNPDANRYNVEDSISRQFRLKTGIMVRLQHPKMDLAALEERLKELYNLRSAIAHGNFGEIAKYEKNLKKKKGEEQYLDDVVTDAYFYLRAVVERYLADPEFVKFVKRS